MTNKLITKKEIVQYIRNVSSFSKQSATDIVNLIFNYMINEFKSAIDNQESNLKFVIKGLGAFYTKTIKPRVRYNIQTRTKTISKPKKVIAFKRSFKLEK